MKAAPIEQQLQFLETLFKQAQKNEDSLLPDLILSITESVKTARDRYLNGPPEPTEAMLLAGARAVEEFGSDHSRVINLAYVRKAYIAMQQAARF